jgi:hypothetical protein
VLATVSYNAAQSLYLSYTEGESAFFAGPVYDFGTAYSGETKVHVFQVKNVWQSPRTIERVAAECGCAVFGTDIQGTTIDVGESIDVPVRWVVPNRLGRVKTKMMLVFSEGVPTRMSLVIGAQVRQRLAFSRDRVFIEAETNDARSQTFTVERLASAPPFELVRVSTDTEFLAATLEDNHELESTDAEASWRVTVSTVPPLPKERIDGHVFFHGSRPDMPPVSLPAVVFIRPVEEPEGLAGPSTERPTTRPP